MNQKPTLNGIVTSRVPLSKSWVRMMSDRLTHDGNIREMLTKQWNLAPSIDQRDILQIEFEEADEVEDSMGYDAAAVMEVAYGHRYLAQFILDRWEGGLHFVVHVSEDELTVECGYDSIVLSKESLKGMEE